MKNQEEDFTGDLIKWSDDGEVMVPMPWAPIWTPQQAGDGPSECVRPSYYVDANERYRGSPVLAVRTSYATHFAGILIGPYTFPKGAVVDWSIRVKQLTAGPPHGDGTAYAIATREAHGEEVWGWDPIYGDSIYRPYDVYRILTLRLISDGDPYWFGGWATWKWASALCVDFWAKGFLSWDDPTPSPEEGQSLTIPLNHYDLIIKLVPRED